MVDFPILFRVSYAGAGLKNKVLERNGSPTSQPDKQAPSRLAVSTFLAMPAYSESTGKRPRSANLVALFLEVLFVYLLFNKACFKEE